MILRVKITKAIIYEKIVFVNRVLCTNNFLSSFIIQGFTRKAKKSLPAPTFSTIPLAFWGEFMYNMKEKNCIPQLNRKKQKRGFLMEYNSEAASCFKKTEKAVIMTPDKIVKKYEKMECSSMACFVRISFQYKND